MKQKIAAMLKKLGFQHVDTYSYANEMCNVVFDSDEVAIADNRGVETYLSLSTYEVFGFLNLQKLI
jgi:hypothetical protein